MKITEKRSPYRDHKIEYTIYEIDKKEFLEMPKEEKIAWLRNRPRRDVMRFEGYSRVEIEGLVRCKILKDVDENTLLLRDKNYKKFLLNLDTCEKTPISQAEYEKMFSDKLIFLKHKRQELLKELAKIEAKIEALEQE